MWFNPEEVGVGFNELKFQAGDESQSFLNWNIRGNLPPGNNRTVFIKGSKVSAPGESWIECSKPLRKPPPHTHRQPRGGERHCRWVNLTRPAPPPGFPPHVLVKCLQEILVWVQMPGDMNNTHPETPSPEEREGDDWGEAAVPEMQAWSLVLPEGHFQALCKLRMHRGVMVSPLFISSTI